MFLIVLALASLLDGVAAEVASLRGAIAAPRRLIFGGDIADAWDWPAYVSFRAIDGWGVQPPINANSCGGTLIGDRWVITARHCAADFDPDVPYPTGYNLTQTYTVGVAFDNEGKFATVPIEKSWIYPDPHFPPEKGNPKPGRDYPGGFHPFVDAALVKLARSATAVGARPVPIYRGAKPFGQKVTAVGMGSCPSDQFCVNGRISLRVREAVSVVASDTNCQPPVLKWGQYNASRSVCMGQRRKRTQTGSGDSGGPLFIFNNETQRVESLGIVSGSVPWFWWLNHTAQGPWTNNFTRFLWTDVIADWVSQVISEDESEQTLTRIIL